MKRVVPSTRDVSQQQYNNDYNSNVQHFLPTTMSTSTTTPYIHTTKKVTTLKSSIKKTITFFITFLSFGCLLFLFFYIYQHQSLINKSTFSSSSVLHTKEYIQTGILRNGKEILNNKQFIKESSQPPKYSKIRYHNSFINDNLQNDLSRTSLLLENVCMNNKGEFLFFTKENIYNDWLDKLFVNENIIKKQELKKEEDNDDINENIKNRGHTSPNNKIISFYQTWRNGKRGGFSLQFILNEIPKSQPSGLLKEEKEEKIKWINSPVLLANRYAAGNIGHLFADNLIGIYELISQFELDPKEVMILFMDEVFYRDFSLNKDRSCDLDLNQQVELLTVNEKTGKQIFCLDETAAYNYDKEKTVTYSLQWTQLITGKPILQKCSYMTNVKSQNQNNEEFPSEKLIYKIEQAPCPLDDFIGIQKSLQKSLDQTNNDNIDNDYDLQNRKTEISFRNLKQVNFYKNQIQVCFKKLLVGTGDRTMIMHRDLSRHKELSLIGLRKTILTNLNLYKNVKTPIHEKKVITIGIHDKPLSGRHGCIIRNIKELLNYLQSKFIDNIDKNNLLLIEILEKLKENNQKIEIISVRLEELSVIEQVELFSKMDIYISTIGSGSLYSLLMPDDSYLFYAPECVTDTNTPNGWSCKHPIIYFHTALPHVTTLDITKLVVDCKFRERYEAGLKLFCDPVLDLENTFSQILKVLQMKLL
ncbi:hypothetical protein ABK040_013597 [Willaertia magna]